MSPIEIKLVCEGQPQGRDIRWLNLVLGQLAESYEPASYVRVVPGGSKGDLSAAVRSLRETLGARHVYAIRDRDFLSEKLLAKDVNLGIYALSRHCLESYLVEPQLVEEVFGAHAVESLLLALAQGRFWSDVASAVLDSIGYLMRQPRLSLKSAAPASKADVTQLVTSMLETFRRDLTALPLDVAAIVDGFALDMDVAPIWTRVRGKELMDQLENELRPTVLPGGDIEGSIFKWCTRHGPPEPLMAEVKRIIELILTPTAPTSAHG